MGVDVNSIFMFDYISYHLKLLYIKSPGQNLYIKWLSEKKRATKKYEEDHKNYALAILWSNSYYTQLLSQHTHCKFILHSAAKSTRLAGSFIISQQSVLLVCSIQS